MAPPVHESVILKPKKPSIIDNNEWPDFRLSQVDVYDGVTGVPTSLLFADADNPLTVVGKIEKLPNDRLGYCMTPFSTLFHTRRESRASIILITNL